MDTRIFSENDRFALQNIYIESRKHAFNWVDSSTFTQVDFDRDTEGELIWVAIEFDNPIGFISIWEPDNFIHNLFVHPDFVGCGSGTKLLDVCLNEIGKPMTLKCSKPNTNARKFYISRGWQVISEGIDPDGEYELMRYENET